MVENLINETNILDLFSSHTSLILNPKNPSLPDPTEHQEDVNQTRHLFIAYKKAFTLKGYSNTVANEIRS